ncbi:MAG: hypothetical protein SWH61_04075 [Thermodesulfobacteriota bacterium]|nr:hypothetical protein [Thermodesulfobacteriota bacterium]
MGAKDEQILRTAKEVVVKFIEIGRISPSTFPESFSKIYDVIYDSVHQKKDIREDANTKPHNE